MKKNVVPGGCFSYDWVIEVCEYPQPCVKVRIKTYDVRMPASLVKTIVANVFLESVILGISIDWIFRLVLKERTNNKDDAPTWNSGNPLTFPDVGCLWIGPKCLFYPWILRILFYRKIKVNIPGDLYLPLRSQILEVLVSKHQQLPLRRI